MELSSNQSNLLGRATIIIAVFSLLAKILGLVRDAIFSHNFGVGPIVDAYFAAFRIPDFIFNLLILGTFSVAFIPIFSEYWLRDKQEAYRLASNILNLTLLLMFILTITAFIFINPLVKLIAPGFEGESYHLTKLFTQIFLLSPIFLSLSSVTSSILNTYRRFTLVALAPVIYNLSIIFGVIVLYPKIGSVGLALGVVVGAFLHFAVQVPQLFKLGFRYSWFLSFKQPSFKRFFRLYWPRIFSMGTSQVTLLVASIFGSFLGSGALAAFYYANNLQSMFLTIFAISSAIAVFPLLSDLYNQQEEQGFKDVLAKTTIQILYFIIPLSVLILVLRAQIVRLILGVGQNTSFTFANTRLVSLTLGLFVVSLFAQALIPLFTRAFYARHNTLIPVVIGFATIAINVVATYFFTAKFGVPGMALAFSITSIVNLLILIGELHHLIGHIRDEYLIINSFKIIIASLFAGIGAYVCLYLIAPYVNMHTYLGVLIQAIGASLAGAGLYLLGTWVLRLEETRNLMRLTRSMLNKFAKAMTITWS